jgi:glycosyltransferase involved in cell wall biosynthesis
MDGRLRPACHTPSQHLRRQGHRIEPAILTNHVRIRDILEGLEVHESHSRSDAASAPTIDYGSRVTLTLQPRPKTMVVLSLISSEGYYGAENMLVTLARKLCQVGCRCIVAVFVDTRFRHPEVAERARQCGLGVEMVKCRGKLDWSTVRQLRTLLLKHDVDVVNPHGYKADLYAYAAVWSTRTALVATVHNWPSRRLSMRTYAVLDRLVLKRFDKIIGVSEVPLNILRRSRVAPNKIATIPNGVDVERFDLAAPSLRNEIASDEAVLVGFVGRLVPDKGGEVLLRAAQQVLAVRPRIKFVFVGDGPSRKPWETLARQLDIDKHVVFVGARRDMPGVYSSLDIVVLPSFVESLPMCLLEGMAAGKPVIATRVGAVARILTSEQIGLLVEPGHVDALAAAILRVVDDPELALRLGKNGRQHVAQHFSAEAMATNYLRHYKQVLADRCEASPNQTALEVSTR